MCVELSRSSRIERNDGKKRKERGSAKNFVGRNGERERERETGNGFEGMGKSLIRATALGYRGTYIHIYIYIYILGENLHPVNEHETIRVRRRIRARPRASS